MIWRYNSGFMVGNWSHYSSEHPHAAYGGRGFVDWCAGRVVWSGHGNALLSDSEDISWYEINLTPRRRLW